MSELPAAARVRLGKELRRLREGRGLTIATVVHDLQWSSSRLSRMESAKGRVGYTDLQALLALYRLSAAEGSSLMTLHQAGREKSPYADFVDIADPSEVAFLEAVHSGILLREFSGGRLPALLQTPAYAEQVFIADRRAGFSIERKQALLAFAQNHFLREDGQPATFVVCESAFLRYVGGRDAFRAQVLSLLRLPAHIGLRVVPFTAPLLPICGHGQFSLVTGPKGDGTDDTAVIRLVTGELVVESNGRAFDQLNAQFAKLITTTTREQELPAVVDWALTNLGRERWQPWGTAA